MGLPPLPIALSVVVANSCKCLMYLAKASPGSLLGVLILRLSKPLPLNLKQAGPFLLELRACSCASSIRRGEGSGLLKASKSSSSPNDTLQRNFRSSVDATLSSSVELMEKLVPAHVSLARLRQYFFVWILSSRYLTASLNTPRKS